VDEGNVKDFEDIRYRIYNRGREPPPGHTEAAIRSPAGYQGYNMAPQRGGGGLAQNRPNPGKCRSSSGSDLTARCSLLTNSLQTKPFL